MIVFRYI